MLGIGWALVPVGWLPGRLPRVSAKRQEGRFRVLDERPHLLDAEAQHPRHISRRAVAEWRSARPPFDHL